MLRIRAAARESTGDVHDVNQDAYCMKVAETSIGDVALMVVCDGMGGLARGELASATVIRAFGDWFDERLPELLARATADPARLLPQVREDWPALIHDVDRRIADYGERHRIDLGTTLSALFVARGRYLVVHVGDSRVYTLYGGRATQLTADQTLIAHELEQGNISLDLARIHPQRNVLMQCVGCIDDLRPQYRVGRGKPGMGFLLCSDGLCHQVTSSEIYYMLDPGVVRSEGALSDALCDLIVLARGRYEQDDITAVAVQAYEEASVGVERRS